MGRVIHDKKIWIVLAELIILAALFSYMLAVKFGGNGDRSIVFGPEDMRSDHMYYENGWKINPESIDDTETENGLVVLQGPYIPLQRGDYTVSIDYQTDENQTVVLYSEDGGDEPKNDLFLKANPFPLYSYRNALDYDFRTAGNIDDLEIRILYNGKGNLCISQIQLKKNLNFTKRLILSLLLLFIPFNIFLFGKESVYKNRDTILAIAGITLLGSLPLLMPGINAGDDLVYHLNRIEGIVNELKQLNIPVRLHSSWFMGMGYPVSVFHGDMLLSVAVLFRIMGFTALEAYKAYIVFINLLTAVVSFFSYHAIFKDKKIAVIAALGYVTANYRFVNIYNRAAVGEYSAMVFFPAIVASIYLIYSNDENRNRPDLKKATILACAISGIIYTHTLSTELSAILVILFIVFNIRKTIRPGVILTLVVAACETVLLTLSYTVPFLDYYLNVPMAVTSGFRSGVLKIQERGTYVLNLFAFFQDSLSSLSLSNGNRASLTPGILLMTCLVVAVALIIYGERDKIMIITAGFSALILLLSTDVFPWNYLSSSTKLFNALSAMEFPWRFLGPASAVLAALLGTVLSSAKRRSVQMRIICECSAVALALLGCIVFYSQYADHRKPVCYYEAEEFAGGVDKDVDDFTRVAEDGEAVTFVSSEGAIENADGKIISREGSRIVFECTTGDSEGIVTAPFYNYKGYRASDTSGRSFDIYDDRYCRVTFDVPANYHDIIVIDFTEPWYWRLAEIITLCSWVVLIAGLIKKKK